MRSALEPGTLRDDVAKRKHNVIFRPIIHDFFEKKKIARGEYMIGRLFNNMSAFGSFRLENIYKLPDMALAFFRLESSFCKKTHYNYQQ